MSKNFNWIRNGLLGSSTLPGTTPGLGGHNGGQETHHHVHGPHCNHDHAAEPDQPHNIHGPGCGHPEGEPGQ